MAPTNDNFNNARVLSGANFSVNGNNIDATYEPDEPLTVGNWEREHVHSVWWTWTAPRTGQVVIDTIDSDFDTTLGVFTGSSVNNLTMLAEDDDSGYGFDSRIVMDVVAGQTYRIAVDGFGNSQGNFPLNLSYAQFGTPGRDSLNGSSRNDLIYGRGGNDNINGNGGYDLLYGEGGDDRINGGSKPDEIYGGDGNDVINGNGGEDWLLGEAGNDAITGSSSYEEISGGSGNDTLNGNGGGDYITGGDGNDRLHGGSSRNGYWQGLYGGAGNDTLFGNGGQGTLDGGEGDDLIYGSSQTEYIYGGYDYGGNAPGNDTIYSNGGDDYINSGQGVDVVHLGGGNTRVRLNQGDGFVTIHNFNSRQTKLLLPWSDTDPWYVEYGSLSFSDSSAGARISIAGTNDLLAVVKNTQASVFVNNPGIFAPW